MLLFRRYHCRIDGDCQSGACMVSPGNKHKPVVPFGNSVGAEGFLDPDGFPTPAPTTAGHANPRVCGVKGSCFNGVQVSNVLALACGLLSLQRHHRTAKKHLLTVVVIAQCVDYIKIASLLSTACQDFAVRAKPIQSATASHALHASTIIWTTMRLM